MENLQGKYLIKLEVDWQYPSVLNEGNLVVYASEHNVELTKLHNSTYHFI